MKAVGLFAIVLVAGLLLQSARVGQGKSPSYVIVEGPTSSGVSGLALVDDDFQRLATTALGARLEFAVSPTREKIAAAWLDSEAHGFLQVFHTKDLSPACAKTPISQYATDTIGFWNPILWIGESALVVEFLSVPPTPPEQYSDRFYAQVFQLPRQPSQAIALHPDYPELIPLPADSTFLLGISDGNAIVLNERTDLRLVNLKSGTMGPKIEVRPKAQEAYTEAPMGWCLKDDSTLLLFEYAGGVKEIQVKPELKVVRRTVLPNFSSRASVAPGPIWKDHFQPDRIWIGTQYLDKEGPVEFRALNGLTLIESQDREAGMRFAPGKDGALLTWREGLPGTIRIQGPSGSTEVGFGGVIGAVVPLE